MDKVEPAAPALWHEELARSDGDIAKSAVVPAAVVHARLRAAIVAVKADVAAKGKDTTTVPSDH